MGWGFRLKGCARAGVCFSGIGGGGGHCDDTGVVSVVGGIGEVGAQVGSSSRRWVVINSQSWEVTRWGAGAKSDPRAMCILV